MLWTQSNKVLVDSHGNPFVCDDCPCEPPPPPSDSDSDSASEDASDSESSYLSPSDSHDPGVSTCDLCSIPGEILVTLERGDISDCLCPASMMYGDFILRSPPNLMDAQVQVGGVACVPMDPPERTPCIWSFCESGPGGVCAVAVSCRIATFYPNYDVFYINIFIQTFGLDDIYGVSLYPSQDWWTPYNGCESLEGTITVTSGGVSRQGICPVGYPGKCAVAGGWGNTATVNFGL